MNKNQIKSSGEPEEENCEILNNIPIEFGSKNYAECQFHLKKISNANDSTSETIKESEKNVKLKESIETELDPVQEFLKNRGNFPISLIRQYYPQREKGYTFDLLPVPFLQNIRSCKIRESSLKSQVNEKPWKDFIHGLPESQYEIVSKSLDKYWRWKMYKKYEPEERTYFRRTMASGPKLDQFGRPPIPDEELNKFRVCRAKPLMPERFKTFLKKGNGHIKLVKNSKK